MASADTSRHPSPSPSEAGKPPKMEGKMFPMGVSEAACQWWTSSSPQAAERKVLSFMPHLEEATHADKADGAKKTPDPSGTRHWRQSMVQLSGKNRALNELSIERVGETQTGTLVMLHGYGAGLAFFYKNFEPLSRIQGLKLYALDLLGMGNSTRSKFKVHAKDKQEQAIEAENWFVDALEEWRKIRNIETFTLTAHSLGGYLAVSYALRYPGRVKKLILVSPVGIPEDPNADGVSVLNPPETTLQQEFVEDQQSIVHSDDSSEATTSQGTTAPRAQTPGWLVCLWESKLSPFSFIRAAGPLGPKLVSGWSSRRFNHLPEKESQALHEYSFSIFKQKGSGEYALNYILTPTVHARRPVINRIHQLGRQPIPQPGPGKPNKETGIPIVFIYGDSDWMDVAGGLAAEDKLNKLNAEILRNATPEEKLTENGSVKVIIVSKAGHHLYLDNPDEFNQIMLEELKTTKEVQ